MTETQTRTDPLDPHRIRRFLDNINPSPIWAQVLNVVGEAGEFAEAYRRYTGHARRGADMSEVIEEMADVIISTSCLAVLMDVDLSAAVDAKWDKIFSRGFGNQARTAQP